MGQDSIHEKSVSVCKKKNGEDKPLKKHQIPLNQEIITKEENANEKQEYIEKYSQKLDNFEKIRSVTPKVERSKLNSLPGSTRSITPLDKGEREFTKPSQLERAKKTPDNQNHYHNRILAEISENIEIRKQTCQYELINSKINSLRNENFDQENFLEKSKGIKKLSYGSNNIKEVIIYFYN